MELIAAELVPPVQLAPQEGAVADVHAPEESKADEEERPGIESLGENEFADRNLELLRQLGMLPDEERLKRQAAQQKRKKRKKRLVDPSQLRRTARDVKRDNMSEKALEKKSMMCPRCREVGHTLASCHRFNAARSGREGLRQRPRVHYNTEELEESYSDFEAPMEMGARKRGRPPTLQVPRVENTAEPV